MLITCSSCNSKYLVNSADLKPSGRAVQCAKCGFNWFQSSDFLKEDKDPPNSSAHYSFDKYTNEKTDNDKELAVSNLPTTYVKDQKPSLVNTLLLLFFFVVVIVFFWIIKNESDSAIALINFYAHEFYFNLKLIINDFVKIVHKILY